MNFNGFKVAWSLLVALTLYTITCSANDGVTTFRSGAILRFSSPLVSLERSFGSGWKTATYINVEGDKFNLFPSEALTASGGVIFGDSSPPKVSPTGKYAVLDVQRSGTVNPGPSGKPEIQSRQYCPVLETKSGCIVSNQSGELCEGQWEKQGDRWTVPGMADDVSKAMLQQQFKGANNLWKEYSNFANRPFRYSINDALASNLGVSNLMACDPPSESNIPSYRNISAELTKEGDVESVEYIRNRLRRLLTPTDIQKIRTDKAFLFDKPDSKHQTKTYLIKGDQVRVLNWMGADWIQIGYLRKDGRIIQGWITAEVICQIAGDTRTISINYRERLLTNLSPTRQQ